MDCAAWAFEEFGSAELGRSTRRTRLVSIAAQVLANPKGTLSGTFDDEAECEGASRYLNSDKCDAGAMELARNLACARRMGAVGGVCVVAVDQTSIRLRHAHQEWGFGSVGNRSKRGVGVEVMTALAMDDCGIPLGIVGQESWARPAKAGPKRKPGKDKKERDTRPAEEKESKYWPKLLIHVAGMLAIEAPGTKAWVQCDRGADFYEVFTTAVDHGLLFTTRLCHERVVIGDDGVEQKLSAWVKAQPVAMHKTIDVPARKGRPARKAIVAVRFGTLDVKLKISRKRFRILRVSIVDLVEFCPDPGQKPLRWRLMTNYVVESLDDVELVLTNYMLRWRVEDFHRAWKSGACKIESSKLRSLEAFRRWAIITSSVAVRIEQLKHLSRAQPDADATTILSRDEVDALILVRNSGPRRTRPHAPGATITVAQATLWIALLGGYSRSRTKPPGTVVLARGFERLQLFLRGMLAARQNTS